MTTQEIKIGIPVIYWQKLEYGKKLNPIKTAIISRPYNNEYNVLVIDLLHHKGVYLHHIDEISAGSLLAAKLAGLEDISTDEIKDATRKFFEEKGVYINI